MDKTVPQITLNWLLQTHHRGQVIVVARNEEQVRQNLRAVDWNLHANRRGSSMRRANCRSEIFFDSISKG
jgi:aryl-alcohol dehydrogenase-like predicted oxidoreductase